MISPHHPYTQYTYHIETQPDIDGNIVGGNVIETQWNSDPYIVLASYSVLGLDYDGLINFANHPWADDYRWPATEWTTSWSEPGEEIETIEITVTDEVGHDDWHLQPLTWNPQPIRYDGGVIGGGYGNFEKSGDPEKKEGYWMKGKLKIEWADDWQWQAGDDASTADAWLQRYLVMITTTTIKSGSDEEPMKEYSVKTLQSAMASEIDVDPGNPESSPGITKTRTATLLPVEVKQLNYPTSTDTTDMGPTQEKVISAGGIAYITGAPAMPRLEARIGNGALASMTVEWRLEVKSERTERGTKDDHRLPQTDETDVVELPIGEPWKIYDYCMPPADFFGGECTVCYRIKGASGYLGTEQKFEFKIRGKNPKDADAKDHIQKTQGIYRFAWAMAQHESRQGNRVHNQFNSGGDGPGNLELPNFGPPDGWGIAQLDTPLGVSASTSEVYSWHKNVTTFYLELAEKRATQQRFFNAVAAAYPSDPEAQTPPTSFTHPGTSTTMTAMEAGTVTLYNGAAGCPNTTLGSTSYQNPWTFDHNRPSGQKWRYNANTYNYLYKVIHDEFEGNLTTQE